MAYFFPVPGGHFERVDQGVDYSWPTASGRQYAVAPGTITDVGSFGDYQGVYEKFDTPIVWRGHTYEGAYYAEGSPLVGLGHIGAGTALMQGQYSELGFLDPSGSHGGAGSVPPLIGGKGSGTQPTQEGYDFFDFIKSIGTPTVPGTPPPTTPAPTPPAPAPSTPFPGTPTPTPPTPGTPKGSYPNGSACGTDSDCSSGHCAATGTGKQCENKPVGIGFVCGGILPQGVCDAIAFLFSVRFLEVLFGGMLVLLGLYLVVREMGQEVGIKLPGAAAAAVGVARAVA